MCEAVGCGSFIDGPHTDMEAAKAAAQADYERRILSVLSQPHPADERVVEALREAESAFEEIRLILVHNLHEPERSAFWKAVSARNAIRAALEQEVRKDG
jgi:hypothetical protein